MDYASHQTKRGSGELTQEEASSADLGLHVGSEETPEPEQVQRPEETTSSMQALVQELESAERKLDVARRSIAKAVAELEPEGERPFHEIRNDLRSALRSL